MMNKARVKLLISFLILMLNIPVSDAQEAQLDNFKGNWIFKTKESKLTFKIGNMFIFNVKGDVPLNSGYFQNSDQKKIEAIFDITAISTGIEKRDNHLRTEDFFYTEKYPQIKFSSNKASKNTIDNGFTYQTIGKLKIRGIEKDETVFFNIEKLSKSSILITGEAKINRLDYEVDHQMSGMDDEALVKFEVKAELKE